MSIPQGQYDPTATESDLYQKWEQSGAFQPDPTALDAGKKPYVITLPPPNITGNLHMGHALQDTIMDILIRHYRMAGRPTLWLPGLDHAAIATNKIIEQQLHDEGKTRHDVGREEFMERTEKWYQETGATIIDQMKALGCSCDWSRQRFTMDEDYVDAINHVFIEYYKKGYIYRGARIVNWDPKTQTTVSDLEIDYQPETTSFYYLKYGPFTIGTARPETKFGDKYVVVHPDDTRYADFKHGDTFTAEWINGPIEATIIKDEAADPNQGSGAMTITPWHSHVDFEIAQRHNLDMEQIIDFDGNLLPIAGEFAGQPITKARSAIVQKLQDKGLVESIDEKYQHNLALNDRGKGVIEPQVMRQWFVDMSKLKDKTIAAAQNEDVHFVPPRWKQHFISWMENVQDWNINRQIWLGHRLPVWWKKDTHGTNNEDGNFIVSLENPNEDKQRSLPREAEGEVWEQDPDTLDTWFSSALWPFATLGWPQNTDDLKSFYPGSALVTARDIIYLWVARMIFSGLEFMGEVPFEDVLIHPTVLAKDGRRMSKSLGTGIDPLELIDQYGADATRFGLMIQMSFDSQAIKFDDSHLRNARNFANKLWNIARLLESMEDRDSTSAADDWIQYRVQYITLKVTDYIQQYKIGEAAHTLNDFAWKEFADWYLEILKTDGNPAVAQQVFDQLLTLLHPFMPYVTESIWSHRHPDSMLITTAWPDKKNAEQATMSAQGINDIAAFQDIVSTIRSARALLGLKPNQTIDIYIENPILLAALQKMTNGQLVSEKNDSMTAFPAANHGLIYLGGDAIAANLDQARTKLEKETERLQGLITKQQGIIKGMTGKAPQDRIDAKQQELEAWQIELTHTQTSLQLLS